MYVHNSICFVYFAFFFVFTFSPSGKPVLVLVAPMVLVELVDCFLKMNFSIANSTNR